MYRTHLLLLFNFLLSTAYAASPSTPQVAGAHPAVAQEPQVPQAPKGPKSHPGPAEKQPHEDESNSPDPPDPQRIKHPDTGTSDNPDEHKQGDRLKTPDGDPPNSSSITTAVASMATAPSSSMTTSTVPETSSPPSPAAEGSASSDAVAGASDLNLMGLLIAVGVGVLVY
ncbi:MAG: hypothetical protein Q9201_003737 [Fulgogasparrea decipioides]